MPTKKAPKKATKKVTKKKVAKKTATKKTTRKSAAKKSTKKAVKKTTRKKTPAQSNKKGLVYAEDHESFWVTNGQILNSLLALRDALDDMEKDVYRYHTDKAENDFANWVESVLMDDACARDLVKAKTPKSARTVVVRHLKLYTT
jgi:hypothetical protein